MDLFYQFLMRSLGGVWMRILGRPPMAVIIRFLILEERSPAAKDEKD